MTDYFAVLEEPRRSWLDPEQLKQKFHALTLQRHPDVQPETASGDESFSTLNEAYRVLQDPKLRLKYFLELAGVNASASSEIPPELADFFWRTGSLLHGLDALIAQSANTTNTLGRALLQTKALDAQKEAEGLAAELRRLHDATLEELRCNPDAELRSLTRSYYLLSYTGRWIAQLDERQFALSIGN